MIHGIHFAAFTMLQLQLVYVEARPVKFSVTGFAQLYAYATSDARPGGAHCLLYMMLMQLQLNLE